MYNCVCESVRVSLVALICVIFLSIGESGDIICFVKPKSQEPSTLSGSKQIPQTNNVLLDEICIGYNKTLIVRKNRMASWVL